MNSLNLARKAYGASATMVRSHSRTEIEAFRRVTHKLCTADKGSNFPEYCQALADNRALWNMLAIDVADSQNALPKQLRAQVFYLAEFTDLQTTRILSGKGDVEPLVSINTAIMRGLEAQATLS